MTQNQLKMEAEIREFLLGDMSADERGGFEERFVSDDGFFEQIRVVEDELIEAYVRGTLTGAEREKFERSFLTTERRRSRVAFTRSMLDKLSAENEIAVAKKTETAAANSSVWNSILEFFKTPRLAFGSAFAILLLAFGGWFLFKDSGRQEIAQQKTTPTPTATIAVIQPDSNQSNQNQPVTPNQNNAANSNSKTPQAIETNVNKPGPEKETPDKNSNARKEKTIAVDPVLALFAGTVRSEGKTRELNLPKNARSVLLQLNLESRDYKIYRAEILTPDGVVVSKSDRLKARNSKINLTVPAQKLPRGDYIVKVSGINPQNETESVADYSFRVVQK